MLKNFTLNGLGLGLKGTNVNNHTIDTEAGPWNWQWREDTLESLPTDVRHSFSNGVTLLTDPSIGLSICRCCLSNRAKIRA